MYKLSSFTTDSTTKQCGSLQFIQLLKSKWDEIHDESNVFRYKISNLQERIVDGTYLLQLNPDRGTNRRMPEEINDIQQPFNDSKFNFLKASPKEVLFSIEDNLGAVHSLFVNVSPISRYHSLLCPDVNQKLAQIITKDSFKLAIEIMFIAQDRSLRIGFNSLCAMASVNHLHYHLFIEDHTLPVERMKCRHLKGPVYRTNTYPSPAFCFQVPSIQSAIVRSQEIFNLVAHLLKHSIAHNILVTRGENFDENGETVRIIVWPRKSSCSIKKFDVVNIAVCELSGWLPVYNQEAYENLSAQDIENELKRWNLDNFEKLCEEIKLIF